MTPSGAIIQAGQVYRRNRDTGWETGVTVRMEGPTIADVTTGTVAADDSGMLLLPALANAHDHGRGLRCTAYGAVDQALESWLPLLYQVPRTTGYLSTAASLCRLARAGVGSVVSCHAIQRPEALASELQDAARAANDVGVRLALVVPLRDRNLLAYGPQDTLLAMLDPADRDTIMAQFARPPLPPREQLDLLRSVAAACDGPLVNIQLGPLGPQWVSDELFELVAEESANTGRRMHMHLLETRYQREWADAAYPNGLLRHLDALGILCERLTEAHGVWLRPEEMALLAERGVIVSVNTCSNLRLRSGLAPVRDMVRHGIHIGLGIDGFTVDDDDDAARELRLLRWLHDGPGFTPGLSLDTIWTAASITGAQAVTGQTTIGTLEPGMAADMMAVDWASLSADIIDPLAEPIELLMARLTRRHIAHLWVAGRQVVRDASVTGVDETAIEAELLRLARDDAARIAALRPVTNRFRDVLRQFYCDGHHQGLAQPDAPTCQCQ